MGFLDCFRRRHRKSSQVSREDSIRRKKPGVPASSESSFTQQIPDIDTDTDNTPAHNMALNIVICGAGLGGLSAAISCAIAGHKVIVLEGARQLAEVGAGLQITPNGAKLLRRWGLGAQVDKIAAIPTTCTVHRYTGKILAHDNDFEGDLRRKFGEPFLDIHRADLQKLLHNRAVELGVEVRLGQRVDHVQQEPDLQVVLEVGDRIACDLVVGADGLWSRCRESLMGTSDKPLPTGDLAYRIVLSVDQLEDSELREWISRPAVHFWIGPGSHVVGYSMKAGRMYNIVLLCPDTLPADVSKAPGSVEEMRALFVGWDPILTRFLDQVQTVDKWKLMHRETLSSWTNKASNFVLMGDACHPMLPYLAQGANSSMEDGAVLGQLLSKVTSREQLPRAIRTYEQVRKARGEAIAAETFKQREAFHMPDGPEQEERDRIFESQLGKQITVKLPSRWTDPESQKWLYGYDAYSEADKAWNSSNGL